MNNASKQEFQKANDHSLEFYSQLVYNAADEHGIVAQSQMSHLRRFNAMLQLGDYHGKSLLDIGCGLGGFYNFLLERGIETDYIGIDINPDMIAKAKEMNPAMADRFMVFDIIENDFPRKFDYSIAIGILNLHFGGDINNEMNFSLMKQMAKHSEKGFAVSMTSNLSPKPTPNTYYFDAKTIIDQTLNITKNYKIDHSYLPNDFTIFGYMEDFFKK